MKRSPKSPARFTIKNKGYEASLEIGKLYRVIPDQETGEDYGYAADRFFSINVPKPLEKALLKAAS